MTYYPQNRTPPPFSNGGGVLLSIGWKNLEQQEFRFLLALPLRLTLLGIPFAEFALIEADRGQTSTRTL